MTVLKDVLKDLLMGSIDDFFSNIGSKELKKIPARRTYLPVFKSGGGFDESGKDNPCQRETDDP